MASKKTTVNYDPAEIRTSAAQRTLRLQYNPASVEAKWQKVWQDEKIFSPDLSSSKKPYYSLMMFPYPSAEGLHAGNMYAFTGADIWGRYQRMKGYDVFEPMGLDGFGIHSENYAIKIGEHPVEVSKRTEKRFYAQLQETGNSFDWTRTLETYDIDYYRWTQWIFVQMFKNGLAYRKKAKVNWCPSCLTVLADEQVIAGACERCSSKVEDRDVEQWFFKITDYADRLLDNLAKIDWTEKIKIAQRNWIGKKTGINIAYKVKDSDLEVVCFTTTPVNWAATFIVIAPEHSLVGKLTTEKQRKAVEKYIKASKSKSKEDRIAEGNEKTGVFTGSYAINHVTGEDLPIWVTDFVLADFGTGAVQGCPGHDMRDFEFAKKFDLAIKRVVVGPDGDTSAIEKPEQVIQAGEPGKMVNSEFLNGMEFVEAMQKTMDYFEAKGWGKKMTTYHLRDWLISRQRYWGPPIPMIYCEKCAQANNGEQKDMPGWFAVPEKDLPVELPYVENFKPTGTGVAPLAQDPKFVYVKCPNCGAQAQRETDVSDTFLDSAWYFLRYPSLGSKTENSKPFDPEITKKWLPVHMYIGGAEHSVLHLMYSRFVTMALCDWGYIDFEEPFTRFYAHGLLIREGAKMSKSKGNVIVPDAYIKKYGADTLRTYLMFLSPFDQGGDFRDTGMEGMYKFVRRVWNLVTENGNEARTGKRNTKTSNETSLVTDERRTIHKSIKRVTEDMEGLRYNRAIAGIMEYVNVLEAQGSVSKEATETLLKLFAPFASHMTEELWQQLGNKNSIHKEKWPGYDPALVSEEVLVIPVQINGKLRGTVKVSSDKVSDRKYIEQQAREIEAIRSRLEGKEIKKVIFVPGKTINFVVS